MYGPNNVTVNLCVWCVLVRVIWVVRLELGLRPNQLIRSVTLCDLLTLVRLRSYCATRNLLYDWPLYDWIRSCASRPLMRLGVLCDRVNGRLLCNQLKLFKVSKNAIITNSFLFHAFSIKQGNLTSNSHEP